LTPFPFRTVVASYEQHYIPPLFPYTVASAVVAKQFYSHTPAAKTNPGEHVAARYSPTTVGAVAQVATPIPLRAFAVVVAKQHFFPLAV
jgi:hypothetical protein